VRASDWREGMPRSVTLVLADPAGELLGALPPFTVDLPYWQETSDVVPVVSRRHGLEVDVLRLLTSERPRPPGGAVTYLAQLRGPLPSSLSRGIRFEPIDPAAIDMIRGDDEKRAPYARFGGPATSIGWAESVLGATVQAVQQRTWNLSAIWRLTTGAGDVVWLKQLPAFYAEPERAALAWFGQTQPGRAPTVLGLGPQGCELMADVPGTDLYEADLDTRLRIAAQAQVFQSSALDLTEDLVRRGIPDRRGPALTDWLRTTLEGWAIGHPAARLLDTLDQRMADLTACGVPDTLVHGDSHSGNVRGTGDALVFLDWGDVFVGHPGFDILGLAGGLAPDDRDTLLFAWTREWQRAVPGCAPLRALRLLRPLAALVGAATYAGFVARIESSEQRYHAADVPEALNAALST
jgi:Phosphotransferase enzyme family